MPATVMNIIFFGIRAVAAAGCGITGIYASSVFQARVRSLTSGLCATAFRLGILTAPYLGQVFLQQQSALVAILLFALAAIIGGAFSIFLPKLRGAGKVNIQTVFMLFSHIVRNYQWSKD